MHKRSSFFAVMLLLASSSARSEADNVTDLTYCLGLKTNLEIAKCSGEVSAGNRKKPYTREQVEELMAQEEKTAPADKREATVRPAVTGENAGMDEAPAVSQEKMIAPASTGEAPVQPATTDEKNAPAISDEEAVQRATTGDKPASDATPEH